LINLRGQIVTALDLRRRLEMPDRKTREEPMNVVIRTEEGALSLLVDEIGDVVEVEQSEFEEVPDTLSGTARELIRGAFKLKDRLLLLLDTGRAVMSAGIGAAIPNLVSERRRPEHRRLLRCGSSSFRPDVSRIADQARRKLNGSVLSCNRLRTLSRTDSRRRLPDR